MSAAGSKLNPPKARTPGKKPSGMRSGALMAFRWAATTNWFLFAVAAILAGISLAASLHTGAWHWFQRSGALLVSIGAIMSTRRPLYLMLDAMIYDDDPAHQADLHRASPYFAEGELRTCVCGFGLVAMGTLIWAYGDLIGCIGQWNAACLS